MNLVRAFILFTHQHKLKHIPQLIIGNLSAFKLQSNLTSVAMTLQFSDIVEIKITVIALDIEITSMIAALNFENKMLHIIKAS